MAEDPWCVYEPGKHGSEKITFGDKTTYGLEIEADLAWTPEATERLERIPSFVRGMLTKRVESYAREKGHTEISLEVMDEVRSEVLGGRVGNVPPFVKKMLSKK